MAANACKLRNFIWIIVFMGGFALTAMCYSGSQKIKRQIYFQRNETQNQLLQCTQCNVAFHAKRS